MIWHYLAAATFRVMLALLAAAVGYLLLLTLASFRAPSARKRQGHGRSRFALMVPAHNEEAVIAGVLESLRGLNYPRDRYALFVVADNCSDATAAVARAHGARVFERVDAERRGKGYALQWLLDRIAETGEAFDACVIFDADTRIDPAFLRVMDEELAQGRRALQAHYAVLNPGDGPGAALRTAAMALVNFLRPLGKNALGCATGLKGNGMCFAASVMAEHGWGAASLAEDAEFGVKLLLAGVPTRFVPEARVWAQMPPAVRQGESQNLRWEAGRLLVVRQWAPRLLKEGLRRRDPVLLEAAVDLLVPPLSALAAGIVGLGLAALLIPPLSGALPAVAVLAGALGFHVLVGMVRFRAPWPVWRALLGAPAYAAWKLALYTRALLLRPPTAWVRTKRFP